MTIIYEKNKVEKKVEIEDVDEKVIRCEDLIKILQNMNPKAICLTICDGDTIPIRFPIE